MTVWVIETGYYEDREVIAVAATLDAAVAYIKTLYGPPYSVVWVDLTIASDGSSAMLRGQFARVLQYSDEHEQDFDIWRTDVVESEGDTE